MFSPSGFQISTHVTKLKQRNNKYAGAQQGFLKRGEGGAGGKQRLKLRRAAKLPAGGLGTQPRESSVLQQNIT